MNACTGFARRWLGRALGVLAALTLGAPGAFG
jgi:hypothetical protein